MIRYCFTVEALMVVLASVRKSSTAFLTVTASAAATIPSASISLALRCAACQSRIPKDFCTRVPSGKYQSALMGQVQRRSSRLVYGHLSVWRLKIVSIITQTAACERVQQPTQGFAAFCTGVESECHQTQASAR